LAEQILVEEARLVEVEERVVEVEERIAQLPGWVFFALLVTNFAPFSLLVLHRRYRLSPDLEQLLRTAL